MCLQPNVPFQSVETSVSLWNHARIVHLMSRLIHTFFMPILRFFSPFSPTQFNDTAESSTKMKRSFYAAKDLYKYRHSYPVKIFSPTLLAVFPCHSTVLRNGYSFNGFLLCRVLYFFTYCNLFDGLKRIRVNVSTLP